MNNNSALKPVKPPIGLQIMQNAHLNKGTAFTMNARAKLGITGLLPPVVETLQQQQERAYIQFLAHNSAIEKNLYLNRLYNENQTLFFSLTRKHLGEMLPVIYTPVIAEAVTGFSRNYFSATGMIVSPENLAETDNIFAHIPDDAIDIAVVTDGEGVLGIGDQGIGGLNIAIGKLMVYTLCGRLNPARTLAIHLDAGTNNESLLADPLYLGRRQKRLSAQHYDDFIEKFVRSFRQHLPDTILHWEDLGRNNARPVLDRYREIHPSFNDDIQGTGAVAVAALMTGIRRSGMAAAQHRICIFGAGTAEPHCRADCQRHCHYRERSG
jgi:malate dehydrogenase (oxaloacetate-decarboxylating)